jgi:hypothetical protein
MAAEPAHFLRNRENIDIKFIAERISTCLEMQRDGDRQTAINVSSKNKNISGR